MKFLLFSDFHYKKGMYAGTVSELEKTIERAGKEKVDLILHGGDFCNDYHGSPELVNCLLENVYGLPVYGVYGNHEMESEHNTMQYVTPHLTNRAEEVVWGTDDGTIGDGSIAYYYFDAEGFRFIFLDSNYSLNPATGRFEHNKEASWGAPEGNTLECSLSPEETRWLENVLDDAAEKDLSCIVTSHVSYAGIRKSAPDADAVRALFVRANEKKKGTVLLAINGHYHTDHIDVRDNILFLDVNTAKNGWWQPEKEPHYTEAHTFLYTDYSADGKPVSASVRPLDTLRMSDQTWYFDEPLSAVVEISRDGEIRIEGSRTHWMYGIAPAHPSDGAHPEISSGTYRLTV